MNIAFCSRLDLTYILRFCLLRNQFLKNMRIDSRHNKVFYFDPYELCNLTDHFVVNNKLSEIKRGIAVILCNIFGVKYLSSHQAIDILNQIDSILFYNVHNSVTLTVLDYGQCTAYSLNNRIYDDICNIWRWVSFRKIIKTIELYQPRLCEVLDVFVTKLVVPFGVESIIGVRDDEMQSISKAFSLVCKDCGVLYKEVSGEQLTRDNANNMALLNMSHSALLVFFNRGIYQKFKTSMMHLNLQHILIMDYLDKSSFWTRGSYFDPMGFVDELMIAFARYNKLHILGTGYVLEKIKESLPDRCRILENKDISWNTQNGNGLFVDTEDEPEIIVVSGIYGIESFPSVFQKPTGDGTSKRIYSYYVAGSMLDSSECNPYYIDIENNIVPTLEANGVEVVRVISPDIDSELPSLPKVPHMHICAEIGICKKRIKQFFKEDRTDRLRRESARIVKSHIDGYYRNADTNGFFINVVSDRLTTSHNPENFRHIYVFGPCLIFGAFASDDKTIPSCLQRKVTKKGYNVVNCGFEWWDINNNMRSRKYMSGDIIILFVDKKHREYLEQMQSNTQLFSVADAYKYRLVLEDVYDSYLHCNYIINEKIANVLYNILNARMNNLQHRLSKNLADRRIVEYNTEDSLQQKLYIWKNNSAYKRWLEDVRKEICDKCSGSIGTIGCIVANCNPFTYGHRYLMSESAKQVDLLIVFVVEENKSYFEFNDRYELVKKGVADIGNILVIPSGRYMISSVTMPAYFCKEKLQNEVINESTDLEFFSRVIAPDIGISSRYVGEEPTDGYTAEYNRRMHEICEANGITVREIPRKESSDRPISASEVRRCIKTKDLIRLKELVPEVTYQYLCREFIKDV